MQPVQIKMARAALDLSVDELASKAGLSHVEIARLESGESDSGVVAGRLLAVFQEGGIELIGSDTVRCVALPAGTIPLGDLSSANDE